MEQKQAGLLIFGLALALRFFFIANYQQDVLVGDGLDYHNLAVNLVNGKGYSVSYEAPYEPYFLRTPGYPIFVASVYALVKPWHTPSTLSTAEFDPALHPEIVAIRIAQALLGSLSCVLFFMTLRMFLPFGVSVTSAILFALYVPLASYATCLLRETFQTFLVLLFSYGFVKFVVSRRVSWLVLFSTALAISHLTLMTTLGLSAFIFIFLWFHFGQLRPALRYTVASAFIVMIVVLPWLYRTYTFYPDWRIAKSMGSSHTVELRGYYKAMEAARDGGKLSKTEFSRLYGQWKNFSERERFDLSFSGTVDGWTRDLEVTKSWTARFSGWIDLFRLAWIESLWVVELSDGRFHLRPHVFYDSHGMTSWYWASLAGPLFGATALFGTIRNIRRLWIWIPAFCYFYVLYAHLAGEPRRMFPVHAFVVLFAVLGAKDLWLITKSRLLKKL